MAKEKANTSTLIVNENYAGANPMLHTTVTRTRALAGKLERLGIPVVGTFTIPKLLAATAEPISLDDAVNEYGVDPDNHLIEAYIEARASNGLHGAALLEKMVGDLANTGIAGFSRLFQTFYPGADAEAQLLNMPAVTAAVKAALAAI